MLDHKVAFRYAKSIAGLAQEKGILDEVHQDMLLFSHTCQANSELRAMLRNPIITHSKKNAVIKALFTNRMNAMTLALFDLIGKKHREASLEGIATEFHLLYNSVQGIQNAEVITAVAIDDQMRAGFVEAVKAMSGKARVELKEKLDPELIGGFVLRVGDRQVDDSVRNRLSDLRMLFSHNPYIKEF
jgi:F-type H+-transporting ATPase subunit delta